MNPVDEIATEYAAKRQALADVVDNVRTQTHATRAMIDNAPDQTILAESLRTVEEIDQLRCSALFQSFDGVSLRTLRAPPLPELAEVFGGAPASASASVSSSSSSSSSSSASSSVLSSPMTTPQVIQRALSGEQISVACNSYRCEVRGSPIMRQPAGIDFNPRSEQFVVADTGNSRLVIFDAEMRAVATVGKRGRGKNVGAGIVEFQQPSGVACSRDRVVVVDSALQRVVVLSATDYSTIMTFPNHALDERAPRLKNPRAVAIDRESSNVVVADQATGQLHIFSGRGIFVRSIDASAGLASGAAATVSGVAIDPFGRILAVLPRLGSIHVFSAHGDFVRAINQLGQVQNLAIHPDGKMAIIDAGSRTIKLLSPTGQLLALASPQLGKKPEQYWGIVFTRTGAVVAVTPEYGVISQIVFTVNRSNGASVAPTNATEASAAAAGGSDGNDISDPAVALSVIPGVVGQQQPPAVLAS